MSVGAPSQFGVQAPVLRGPVPNPSLNSKCQPEVVDAAMALTGAAPAVVIARPTGSKRAASLRIVPPRRLLFADGHEVSDGDSHGGDGAAFRADGIEASTSRPSRSL